MEFKPKRKNKPGAGRPHVEQKRVPLSMRVLPDVKKVYDIMSTSRKAKAIKTFERNIRKAGNHECRV